MAIGQFTLRRLPERHDAPETWRGRMVIVGHPYQLEAHIELDDGGLKIVGSIEPTPEFAPTGST